MRDVALVPGLSVDAFAAGEAGAATGTGPSPPHRYPIHLLRDVPETEVQVHNTIHVYTVYV